MAEWRSEDKRLLRELARALDAGDAVALDRAFEAIYRTYVRSVALVCARLLRDNADIQSVTNDVFVAFFRRMEFLDTDELGSLRAYLTTAAKHAALDHLRAQSLREGALADTRLPAGDGEGEADLLSMLPDPDGDVTVSVRYVELTRDLGRTVGEEAAEIILARAVCGESFPAIAARLGKKENTVKTIYHRAIQKFRREKGDRWL